MADDERRAEIGKPVNGPWNVTVPAWTPYGPATVRLIAREFPGSFGRLRAQVWRFRHGR